MSPRLLVRLPLPPVATWRRQAGFTLLEVSFVVAVAGALSIGALEMLRFQQMVEQGRHAGERLAALRDGAAAYTRDHGRTILAQVPDHQRCAAIELSSASAVSPPPGASSALAGCGLKIDGQPVANGYQPTVAELQALGYVRLTDELPFTHGDSIVDGHTGARAVPRWRVSMRCNRHCAPVSAPVSEAAPPKPVFSLMLFNTQPFFPQGRLEYGQAAQLKAAAQAIGPDALISPPGSSPHASRKLRSVAGQPAANPLRDAAGGVPGVLATLTYVDTASSQAVVPTSCGGTSGITCQDGSAKPTATWDFNGQTLNNLGRLAVTGPANITGELTAGQRVLANGGLTVRHPSGGLEVRTAHDGSTHTRTYPTADIHGHTVVRKHLVVGHDVDRYFLDDVQDGMSLSGVLLTRNGYIDVASGQRGGVGFDPRLAGIRIPMRNPGDPCNAQDASPRTSGGNIALHQASNSTQVYVMACSAQGRWVKASGG